MAAFCELTSSVLIHIYLNFSKHLKVKVKTGEKSVQIFKIVVKFYCFGTQIRTYSLADKDPDSDLDSGEPLRCGSVEIRIRNTGFNYALLYYRRDIT